MTFDLEDWADAFLVQAPKRIREHRIREGLDWVLQLLSDGHAGATCFVVGRLAREHPEWVREIAGLGHEIACHGQDHQRVDRLTAAQFREQARTSKRLIEDLTGQRAVGYRAPGFSITFRAPWAFDILSEEEFQFDSSCYLEHWPWRLPPSGIHEIPLATARAGPFCLPFSGGTTMKWLPYRLFAWGLRRARSSFPAVAVYLHPWDFFPPPKGMGGAASHYLFHRHQGRHLFYKWQRLLSEMTWVRACDTLPEHLQAASARHGVRPNLSK
ncbi:MAG: polysaccharide deacetylase family protein [Nitrospirae bacterium]|nr:polysaccharide deacetylase family protein [Nitrospirota bacterium]